MFSSKLSRAFALLFLVSLWVGSASASPVHIDTRYQVEGVGFFDGSLDYLASSSTNATLTLILNNLPATGSGGRITGVALNLPNDGGISNLVATGPNGYFSQLGLTNNGISAVPLGRFDFGSALGGNWQGGGSPSHGIGVGSSGTFVFNFSGTNLDALTALSFINATAPGNTNGQAEFIAVRFRGFANGESDKVTGVDPPPVPVPASVWLMFSELGGLGAISRRRKIHN